MPPSGEISHWIGQLKAGDTAAPQKLWENYYQRLVILARGKLQGMRRSAADEEDVALSAFASFCRGAERNRFPQLADRTDLWKLLVVITARKACDLRTRENRLKRGGGKVAGESALPGPPGNGEPGGLAEVIGREPTPAFAAQLAEEYHQLLEVLGDADLRSVAVRKVEGFTNEEIAVQIGRSLATVERKLQLIRRIWEKERNPVA
jgi:DNA-directed RNA polymerase specialized sigma24 family protein